MAFAFLEAFDSSWFIIFKIASWDILGKVV